MIKYEEEDAGKMFFDIKKMFIVKKVFQLFKIHAYITLLLR